MEKRVCIVGLDKPEYTEIREQLNVPVIATEVLPKIAVIDGQLLVQPPNRMTLQPVSKIVFHGIFEDDMDFITGLALWGGPCLPNAAAMMDCRLKLPCLARALRYTKFGSPARGYAARGAMIETDQEYVAKWGNWHCGENKTRFSGTWTSEEPSIIEPFFEGQAVRILMIGEKAWQIRLEGDDWLKSIHDANAALMDIAPELVEDTERIRQGFGLELLANDYIVGSDGTKHLLEVNHIPDINRFPEVWAHYRDYVVDWINQD
jgi:hypothetical protein